MVVNVGTVQETTVNIGLSFATKFQIPAPFMVNISFIIKKFNKVKRDFLIKFDFKKNSDSLRKPQRP